MINSKVMSDGEEKKSLRNKKEDILNGCFLLHHSNYDGNIHFSSKN